MSPTQEGPPTAMEIQDFINNIGLREVQDRWGRCVCCKKKGQWVPWWHETWKEQHESNCIFYLSKAFSRRFSYKDLECKEKRTAALDALMHNFELLLPEEGTTKGLNPKEVAEYCGNLETILLEARDKLDALSDGQTTKGGKG